MSKCGGDKARSGALAHAYLLLPEGTLLNKPAAQGEGRGGGPLGKVKAVALPPPGPSVRLRRLSEHSAPFLLFPDIPSLSAALEVARDGRKHLLQVLPDPSPRADLGHDPPPLGEGGTRLRKKRQVRPQAPAASCPPHPCPGGWYQVRSREVGRGGRRATSGTQRTEPILLARPPGGTLSTFLPAIPPRKANTQKWALFAPSGGGAETCPRAQGW